LTFANGLLFARRGGVGPLWRTDGTVEGTFVVHPLIGFPTGFGFKDSHAVLEDGTLVFQGCAAQPQEDCEPWRTDGSVAGTFRLGDLNPGSDSSWADGYLRVGAEIWFQATLPDPPFGEKPVLYRTDGTVLGTSPLPRPPGLEMRTRFAHAAALGGGLVFVGCDEASGCEPWFTDGVSTLRIDDLAPGPDSSVPMSAQFDRPRLTAIDDAVLFIGTSGSGGRQLWRTDATSFGTVVLSDFDDLPQEASFGWFAIFAAPILPSDRWVLPVFRADRGVELWSSDGSAAGTSRIGTIGKEAHSAAHPVRSRWTLGRRACAAPLRQGVVAKSLHHSEAGTAHLVFSDGVPGTVEVLALLDELDSGGLIECVANETEVLASSRLNYESEIDLWRTRGAATTTEVLVDNGGILGSSPTFERHRDAIAYADGSTLSLVPRGATDPGAILQLPTALGWGQLVSGGELLFHTDLWGGLEVTDGEAEPTLLLEPASEVREISDATSADGRLFFVHVTPEEGPELWSSDGSSDGTAVVRNLQSGPSGGFEPAIVGFDYWNHPLESRIAHFGGGRVVFPGDDGSTGVELWASDGTEAGTVVVADITPGPDGSWPRHLVSLGNGLVLFAAEHPTFGYELFRTDGTAVGTSVVRDLVTGVGSSVPDDFVVQDGVLYFSAWTPSHGREAWRSDGTFAGTYRLTDVAAGPLSSSPSRFVRRGNRLFFTATDHVHGFELWARADDGSVPLFIDGFETEDASRWSSAAP
jgi:ELWxxDGT repeat protein